MEGSLDIGKHAPHPLALVNAFETLLHWFQYVVHVCMAGTDGIECFGTVRHPTHPYQRLRENSRPMGSKASYNNIPMYKSLRG